MPVVNTALGSGKGEEQEFKVRFRDKVQGCSEINEMDVVLPRKKEEAQEGNGRKKGKDKAKRKYPLS